MTKRAVLYARVSGDDTRKEGRNLESQIAMCREHAQSKSYEIVTELAEDERGASGRSFNLEQIDRALEMARSGAFDVLVVRELDRFARSLAKQLIVEEELRRAGVEIDYVLGEYPDTPEGNLNKNVKAVIAEYEALKTAERTARGRRNVVKAGKVLLHGDRPPYGYRVSDDGDLAIHEPEARIVQLVFDLYVGERISLPKVAARLSEMGIPTWEDVHELTERKQRRYGVWAAGTIAKMLHSETYKGIWHYGKANSSAPNPREEWIAVEVPAIVSGPLWDAAQKQAKHNRRTAARNVRHEYLMRYRLTCACGYKVQCQAKRRRLADGTTRDYLYYSCSGIRKANVRPCDLPSFRADAVDAAIWAWVHDWLLHPKQLAREIRTRQQQRGEELAPLRERLRVVDDLIADNEGQLERLLDLYLTGKRTKELLTQRHGQLESTIDTLKNERAKLLATLEAQMLTEEQIASITELGAEIRARLESGATFERQRRVIEMLDVCGVLAVEDGEKVVYVQCTMAGLSGELDLSIASTSSWSGGHNAPTFTFTARLVLN